MNLNSLFVPGAIVLGLTLFSVSPAHAQSRSTTAESPDLGLDLKLNPQQRRAIELIGDFALDQMESILANGLNPKKLDRVEAERQTESLRQTISSLRLDDQQKAVLRTILQTAREQMKQQMNKR
ncbi:MAG: hypothetical protein NW224_14845 [Leptolyngbyaceae cyanobacterium bins.302]|nr:hypothetical protein [Leptolyngbyaceae cyanobacterium bins.302]